MPPANLVFVSVLVPKEVDQELRALAIRDDETKSVIIRRLLRAGVNQERRRSAKAAPAPAVETEAQVG